MHISKKDPLWKGHDEYGNCYDKIWLSQRKAGNVSDNAPRYLFSIINYKCFICILIISEVKCIFAVPAVWLFYLRRIVNIIEIDVW